MGSTIVLREGFDIGPSFIFGILGHFFRSASIKLRNQPWILELVRGELRMDDKAGNFNNADLPQVTTVDRCQPIKVT